MQSIYKPDLLKILPESILLDPKIKAAAQALSSALEKLSFDTREVLHLPRLDELDGRILDFLAEQFSVDFYEPLHLSDAQKKNLIRTSIAWHRRKGTVAAVEEIAAQVFRDIEISEWFDYGGLPYHFQILTHGYTYTPDGLQTFLRMINVAKNVRSHLDKIIIDYSDNEPINLFAGIAELTAGVKEISLPKPKDIEQKIFAGNVLYKSGVSLLEPSRPKDLFQKIYAAQVLQRSGEITIDSADDVPHHDEHQTLKRSYKLKFFAGFGHGLFGMKTLDLPKPPDLKNKLHVGVANVKRGEISIDFDRKRNFLQEMKLRAAQAVVRAGEITIGSATKPSVDPEYRAYSSKVNLHAGIILSKLGAIKLDALRQSYFGRERAQIHVGQVIIKAGEITIGCAEETFPDVDTPLDGNFLRLYFDYATGRDHPLLLKDPRDDLIIGDVKTLGDFSADEKIFVNDDGEYTLGIHQADLISGYNVQKSSDFEKIPTGDALRLFFDFATGNKRKILVRNQKENLTAGDLKTLGNVAAQSKVIINAYGESTRGLTHAAVIKRFKVGAHNADEEIKF